MKAIKTRHSATVNSRKPVSADIYNQEYYQKYNHGYEEFLETKDLQADLNAKVNTLDFRGKRVLDIACGRGEFVRLAALSGATEAHGIDYSNAAIEISKGLMGDLAKDIKSKIHLQVMDAKDLKYKDNFFDIIVMFDIVEHLHDWELEKCLDEAHRILKPDGQILIHTTPNKFMMSFVRVVLKPFGVILKSSEYHVNEHTYFLMKKNTHKFNGKTLLEKDKRYWQKQMIERPLWVKKLASLIDILLDNPPIHFVLSSFPINILSCTDIWFIGTKNEIKPL